ncbi:MAG: protein-methionine-sulfoxide reductase catalytic subunit MsrP [Sedimenticola sp.]|nr:MAG: protein-methionine-sulfoxide reductase catalytic subunit MsrP [Sedimenticola sp.]
MLIKKPDEIKSSELTDESVYKSRRRFLSAIAAATGLSIGGGYLLSGNAVGKPESNAKSDDARFADLPDGPYSTDEEVSEYSDVTTYNNFYELGTSKEAPARNAHQLITQPWSVTVSGECDKPGVYNLEDILDKQPLEDRIYRLRCVETWSAVIPWVGFSLADTLKRFQPNSKAKYVQFVTIHDPENLKTQNTRVLDWPYREGLRIDEAMHPLATLAVGMYGRILPNQNGAPLRLVVPWKYGFKSIKSIVAIHFTNEEPEATWNMLQPSEYGFYANVNPAVSHPRWSQSKERRLGEWLKRETLPFNGYAEQVAGLYSGMDLKKFF